MNFKIMILSLSNIITLSMSSLNFYHDNMMMMMIAWRWQSYRKPEVNILFCFISPRLRWLSRERGNFCSYWQNLPPFTFHGETWIYLMDQNFWNFSCENLSRDWYDSGWKKKRKIWISIESYSFRFWKTNVTEVETLKRKQLWIHFHQNSVDLRWFMIKDDKSIIFQRWTL